MADHPGSPSPPPPPDPPIVPINPAEYPNYYFARYGRPFPTLRLPLSLRGNTDGVQLPSVLPVDRIDMERREVQHNLAYLILNHRHWFGPFEAHLTPPNNRTVVDIGSGNGKWDDDVSDEPFQDVKFWGVEIVPMRPFEHPLNVTYEVYDFQQEGIRQDASTVDIVHARFQNVQILDWRAFLIDAARVLKPGGLFMSGEMDLSLEESDGRPLESPATAQFYNQVQNLMRDRGYTPDVGVHMPNLLHDAVGSDGAPLFTNVGSDVIAFPVGRHNQVVEQREISTLAMEFLDRQAASLRPFLLSTGQAEIEVGGLVDAHRQELNQMNARTHYRIAWAERR
ncbi:hypothetical protein BDV93DRAFT_524235 [Ceratobasidium sp. AG-I]|nr:hypothetical protein BDV93DRAFT_524235 [Ceratobasidium sp. AG-I]